MSVAAVLYAVEQQRVDLTPIIAGIVAGVAGGGGVGWYTRRQTNRRLAAEGEKLYQEALAVAEQRGEQAVATVDNVRRILEDRLTRAETDLASARQQLAVTEEKLRRLEAEADTIRIERDRVVAEARHERELLMRRVHDLEEQVQDLVALSPGSGRRRRDRDIQ